MYETERETVEEETENNESKRANQEERKEERRRQKMSSSSGSACEERVGNVERLREAGRESLRNQVMLR